MLNAADAQQSAAEYDIEPLVGDVPASVSARIASLLDDLDSLVRLRYEVASILVDLFHFALQVEFMRLLPLGTMNQLPGHK